MFNASSWGSLINYFLIYGVGFVLGSYGGLFSEASGIINIALEGSMVFGGYAGILMLTGFKAWCAGTWLVTTQGGLVLVYIVATLVAILAGLLFSFLLSFVSIKLKADQTIVGTALNTLAVAICVIINVIVQGKDTQEIQSNIFTSVLLIKTGNQFIDSAFSGLNISILLGVFVIIALWLVINKTRFGLRLRACGENPAAADSVGINVSKMRYLGTAIGSSAAAMAGFVIFSCMPIGTWTINALGYGFLVLAIEIFGNWKATNIIFCSLFFAFFFAFAPTFVASLGLTPNNGIKDTIFGQKAFYYLLPYLLALIVLILFSKKSRAPKAEGIPYDKSTR